MNDWSGWRTTAATHRPSAVPAVFTLSSENAVAYLVSQGVISVDAGRRAVAESLGGGVSNIVIKVSWEYDGSGALVLKQSLPKLRVEEDWFADQARIHREWMGIDYVSGLGGPDDGPSPAWGVPRVIHRDRENFIFAMCAAPFDSANWKDQLLGGHIDTDVAARVGEMLGEIHRGSMIAGEAVPEELAEFADLECFVQLRIDPYHRATAAAHPDLADVIENEAQRMLPSVREGRALVHGDFSPKNIIVSGLGGQARVWLLDFEVVHLGNAVFDLAFMLNHFTLKAIYNRSLAREYCEAAGRFWAEYLSTTGSGTGDGEAREGDTVRQVGALLLARIDGKSPAEYITDDGQKQYARRLARRLLTSEITALDELLSWLCERR